ncbi:MAG: sigma-54-dependent transcriptional regulator [Granulosicoccus sp.]
MIIDDEADIRELIALSLGRMGLDTHTASNLQEARNLLENYRFDVCLTDMRLPDGSGLEFVKYLQETRPQLPIAVVTAYGNMSAAVEAMKNGAFDFVSKPVDLGLLRNLVNQAINVKDPHRGNSSSNSNTMAQMVTPVHTGQQHLCHSRENQNAGGSLPSVHPPSGAVKLTKPKERARDDSTAEQLGANRLIGRSELICQLRRMIVKVTRTNAPVWITGESGTGKELIARLIHDTSPRASAAFVAVNCGAIPSDLMESEMFGHCKGSFTGAHADHDGLFKRAEGGTLFLDEVAELPLAMQVKLLRTIQERTIRPVGSSHEVNIDVRILSASHKNLALEVDENRFRHDLYYRLNVICIHAPSLRDRPEDILDIATHVMARICHSGDSHIRCLSTQAIHLLEKHTFPGNVRELENILERAIALSDSEQIQAEDLIIDTTAPCVGNTDRVGSGINCQQASDERSKIRNALDQTHWNRKSAAKILGMTYRQLRYRINRYGLDKDTEDEPV